MAPLFLSFIGAFCLLIGSVNAYRVKGIAFNSSDGYLRRNFTGMKNFKIFVSSTNGRNRTVFIYTFEDEFELKLIHRYDKLVLEEKKNETLGKLYSTSYDRGSYFFFSFTWYIKIGVIRLKSTKDNLTEVVELGVTGAKVKNSTLYFGDPFSPGSSFQGTIAWVDYRFGLEGTFCFKNPIKDLSFQRQLNEWEIFAEDYERKDLSTLEVCEPIGRVAIISSKGITGFDPIQTEFCKLLGGKFLDDFYFNKNITVWHSKRCLAFSLDHADKTCFPNQPYFGCFIPAGKFVIRIFTDYEKNEELLSIFAQFIISDSEDKGYDINYHFISESHPEANITYRDGKWHLDFGSKVDGYELDSLTPFGRQSWESKIAKGQTHEIEIFNCKGSMLPCNDGTCYSPEERCDGKEHCKDGIDERDCAMSHRVIQEHDLKVCCSEKASNCEDDTVVVNYAASVIDIQEINYKHERITMEMRFAFKWRDHRLVFVPTLNNLINGSSLPVNPSRDLILNEKESETNVGKSIADSQIWIEGAEIDRGDIYEGKKIRIWNNFTVKFSFPCPFDFTEFPFGRQTFNISLTFDNCYSKYDLKSINKRIDLEFSKKQRGDFILSSVSDKVSDRSRIDIQISLESHSSYYVLTSFTPTVFMCLVAYCTLYFRLSSFPERITISATALLTLAVMFTDVSDKIVRTSYPKLIDIWFIGCIAYSAIVVLLNGFLHYLSWHLPLSWNFTRWFTYFRVNLLTRRGRSYSMEMTSNHQEGDTHSVTSDLATDHSEDSTPNQEDLTQQTIPDLPQPTADHSSRTEHLERVINNAGRVVLLAAILLPLVFLKIAYL